jgi:hypothetical protein
MVIISIFLSMPSNYSRMKKSINWNELQRNASMFGFLEILLRLLARMILL